MSLLNYLGQSGSNVSTRYALGWPSSQIDRFELGDTAFLTFAGRGMCLVVDAADLVTEVQAFGPLNDEFGVYREQLPFDLHWGMSQRDLWMLFGSPCRRVAAPEHLGDACDFAWDSFNLGKYMAAARYAKDNTLMLLRLSRNKGFLPTSRDLLPVSAEA